MTQLNVNRMPEGSSLDLERPRPAPKSPNSTSKGAPTIQREITPDQVCVLTFDRPDSSANIFDRATLVELNEHVDFVAGHSGLTGLVLMSAKKSIFIAGADLHSISAETDESKLRQLIEFGQAVFNRIAALRIPTVAAIHGACVGGGFEITLACDWRVASDDRATRIGLPETQIGLLPAWGGSTRLPRLIGLPKALDIILAGKTPVAKQALKYGMIDALVPREYLRQTAWQKIRSGKPHRSARPLMNNPLTASVLAFHLRRQLEKKTRGHYPSVTKALEVVTKGISRSTEASLRLEVEGMMELTQSPATRQLIDLFFLQERAKKFKVAQAPSLSAVETGKAPVRRSAVIGAGVMGAGIAQWLSARGLPVVLRDLKPEFIARGMSTISRLYSEGAKRHVFTRTEARAGMDRISPAVGEVPLGNVDLVIEAAIENISLKKELFGMLEHVTAPQTILATNTSALPISEIAAGLAYPERVVGIHFFNPVHRMQLVEVVRARQTSPATLQRAIQFVQQIGKLPLLVNDSPGFLVNRILVPYLIEAGLLFEAGAEANDIDEAMLEFGMPMGPLRLLDEVGLDVAHHISGTLSQTFPAGLRAPQLLEKMVKAGWIGKKAGRGFYVHAKGAKTPRLNGEVNAVRTGESARSLSRHQLQERMVLLMVNEAARCLAEQVVASPEDVDFGMVMGTGFAPFRGGPLRYADSAGLAKIVAAMRSWANAGVGYLAPCASLQAKADQGGKFYSHKGEAA